MLLYGLVVRGVHQSTIHMAAALFSKLGWWVQGEDEQSSISRRYRGEVASKLLATLTSADAIACQARPSSCFDM